MRNLKHEAVNYIDAETFLTLVLSIKYSVFTPYKASYLPVAQISLQTNIIMNFSSENTLQAFYQQESETRALVGVTSQKISGK